jgi:hypothetical protein
VPVRTFNKDYGELAALVDTEWSAKYGKRTRFDYTADWARAFFGAPETNAELLLEYRDARGAMSGFVGAVPRSVRVNGTESRLELVTLLTSARRNPGLVAFELLREVFSRARMSSAYGIYNCCVEDDRTVELLRYATASTKLQHVEVAKIHSLTGFARPVPESETEGARLATKDDVAALVDLLAASVREVPLVPVVAAETLRAAAEEGSGRRVVILSRARVPVAICMFQRRRLRGESVTEVANLELLVGPAITPVEARAFGKAIAREAAATGATLLVGYRKAPAVFPHLREAGLRLAQRAVRVFVTPSDPSQAAHVAPGAEHLLEIE